MTARTYATEKASRTIQGYAASSAAGKLAPHRFDEKPLRPMVVEIRVTHCGIGQRVGVGFLAGADFTCDECAAGRDNLCEHWEPTCIGREGGFAERVVADSRLAFPIPDAIASEHAAPLMCAGVTVFAPLLRHASAATRLGVVGIGGLGHLALQFGRAFGCHVTAFTTSPSKAEEARRFGAHEVVDASQPGALAAAANSCDLLLCTAAADVPWNDYVGVLRRNGKLCLLGIPGHELSLSPVPLIFFQGSVVSSGIGSRLEMRQMLDFAARHHIAPQVEVFPMNEVNSARERRALSCRTDQLLIAMPISVWTTRRRWARGSGRSSAIRSATRSRTVPTAPATAVALGRGMRPRASHQRHEAEEESTEQRPGQAVHERVPERELVPLPDQAEPEASGGKEDGALSAARAATSRRYRTGRAAWRSASRRKSPPAS